MISRLRRISEPAIVVHLVQRGLELRGAGIEGEIAQDSVQVDRGEPIDIRVTRARKQVVVRHGVIPAVDSPRQGMRAPDTGLVILEG